MIETILTSLITSLIVSLLTFTLGLRVGKNQVDRPKLKEYYRKLAVHFIDLTHGIEQGIPKNWESFVSKAHPWETVTVVSSMMKDGTIIDLPNDVAEKVEELETAALRFGWEYSNIYAMEGQFILDFAKEYYQNPFQESQYEIKAGIGNTYKEIRIGQLIIKSVVDEIASQLVADSILGISFKCKINDKVHTITLYQDGINIPLSTLIEKVHSALAAKPCIAQLLICRQQLITQLVEITELLKRKTEDPHPFWETIRTAFRDVVK